MQTSLSQRYLRPYRAPDFTSDIFEQTAQQNAVVSFIIQNYSEIFSDLANDEPESETVVQEPVSSPPPRAAPPVAPRPISPRPAVNSNADSEQPPPTRSPPPVPVDE